MNRRGFLKSIFMGLACIAAVPLITAEDKCLLDRVPCIQTDNGFKQWGAFVCDGRAFRYCTVERGRGYVTVVPANRDACESEVVVNITDERIDKDKFAEALRRWL